MASAARGVTDEGSSGWLSRPPLCCSCACGLMRSSKAMLSLQTSGASCAEPVSQARRAFHRAFQWEVRLAQQEVISRRGLGDVVPCGQILELYLPPRWHDSRPQNRLLQ